MSNDPVTHCHTDDPIRPSVCRECPFAFRMTQEDANTEGMTDFPWTNPERPFLCHVDGGEFDIDGVGFRRCAGFYGNAKRLGIITDPNHKKEML